MLLKIFCIAWSGIVEPQAMRRCAEQSCSSLSTKKGTCNNRFPFSIRANGQAVAVLAFFVMREIFLDAVFL
ncbi:MAG: hypothetical protein FD164_584 [Nitrospirae bacterium]|nr:MAG: hypothetical protein FD164_584 [Nitrospirota bacterium]